ncbi:EamA family transporter [Paraburkholderia sp. NMBU_R16]|uniref:DMT family transporter n=1 Tax=Paraburkholderia sp. NMBU_R16 TaxID=2698676 RepID=UPI00156314AE|nr:DMT family transporter [Paraburkholderia sp. NMBU_R16]NRO98153.1 EamA family transporter [Paraburkholderia sp. NMBU_R16]
MAWFKTALAAYGATALFVLLWSSGAIFAETGVTHAGASVFLAMRFALATVVLALIGAWRRRWLPARGTRIHVAATGALMIGGYSICYFLSLERGLTPGLLAVILGAQPIATLLATERRFSAARVGGLLMAMLGLASIVFRDASAVSPSTREGLALALAALACITAGAIMQKRIVQEPMDVLPLQNFVGLLLSLTLAPAGWKALRLDAPLVVSVFWLGIVISVLAQLLFYRLVRRGNLVNVTSLFYLVPVITALMDYLFFGHVLQPRDAAGMVLILGGLALTLRSKKKSRSALGAMVGERHN